MFTTALVANHEQNHTSIISDSIELIHNSGGQEVNRTTQSVKIIPYPAVARIKDKITLIETIGVCRVLFSS